LYSLRDSLGNALNKMIRSEFDGDVVFQSICFLSDWSNDERI